MPIYVSTRVHYKKVSGAPITPAEFDKLLDDPVVLERIKNYIHNHYPHALDATNANYEYIDPDVIEKIKYIGRAPTMYPIEIEPIPISVDGINYYVTFSPITVDDDDIRKGRSAKPKNKSRKNPRRKKTPRRLSTIKFRHPLRK